MPFESTRSLYQGVLDFRVRNDGTSPNDLRKSGNPATWYRGILAAPDPERGIRAVFNGPLIAVRRTFFSRTRLFHFPRVMDHPQIPGKPDRTAYFAVHELSADKLSTIEHAPIPIETIQGTDPLYSYYGVEDIRITRIGRRIFLGAATAELCGKPYPMMFKLRYTRKGWEVGQTMELIEGVAMGKNPLLLTKNMGLHRLETDDDTISVIKRNQAGKWDVIDKIIFPYITAYNEQAKNNGVGKKRIGLTGGARIPMPNGNFRWILHEVTNTAADYNHPDSISTYQFRLAEFSLDKNGIPRLVAADSEPFMTYDQVIALAGPGVEPDPKKRVIYSVGGAFNDKDEFLLPVTVRDREEHLFVIPLADLQRPFATQTQTTSQRRGLRV